MAPPTGRDDRLCGVRSHPQVYVLDTAHARQPHTQDTQGQGEARGQGHCGWRGSCVHNTNGTSAQKGGHQVSVQQIITTFSMVVVLNGFKIHMPKIYTSYENSHQYEYDKLNFIHLNDTFVGVNTKQSVDVSWELTMYRCSTFLNWLSFSWYMLSWLLFCRAINHMKNLDKTDEFQTEVAKVQVRWSTYVHLSHVVFTCRQSLVLSGNSCLMSIVINVYWNEKDWNKLSANCINDSSMNSFFFNIYIIYIYIIYVCQKDGLYIEYITEKPHSLWASCYSHSNSTLYHTFHSD